MKVIGITGGIGSGKSVVARLLRLCGFPVYDSDACAKLLYDEDAVLRQNLMTLFGAELYADGKLDRNALAALIFADKAKLQQVNALVHPAVFRDFDMWCKRQNAEFVFVESAILLQTDFCNRVDAVLLVDAPENVRVERVCRRNGATEAQVTERMKAQMPSAEMRTKADFVVENDGTQSVIAQTDAFVRNFLPKI